MFNKSKKPKSKNTLKIYGVKVPIKEATREQIYKTKGNYPLSLIKWIPKNMLNPRVLREVKGKRELVKQLIKNSFIKFKGAKDKIHAILELTTLNKKFMLPTDRFRSLIDIGIINEVFLNQVYSKHFPIKDTDIIVDIGAHRGYTPIFFSDAAKKGHVFAIEPVANNYTYLTKNVTLNNAQNVSTHKLAISDRNGTGEIGISKGNTGGHSIVDSSLKEKERVELKTLTKFMEEQKINYIDVLKIDVEGAEFDIIRSLNSETLSRIKNIAFECHEWIVPKYKDNVRSIVRFLKKNGFEVNIDRKEFTIYARNTNYKAI